MTKKVSCTLDVSTVVLLKRMALFTHTSVSRLMSICASLLVHFYGDIKQFVLSLDDILKNER